jgi:hypothetical protein
VRIVAVAYRAALRFRPAGFNLVGRRGGAVNAAVSRPGGDGGTLGSGSSGIIKNKNADVVSELKRQKNGRPARRIAWDLPLIGLLT